MRNKFFSKNNLLFILQFCVIALLVVICVISGYEKHRKILEEEVPLAGIGVYKYCPTVINGNVLYCSNEATPGEVKDGICFNGQRVLTTSQSSWDSVQVCDPTIVEGNFSYLGSSYKYLMAYLGCATYDCTANEVGLAVSNDLVKWKKTGRVVAAVRDGHWGVGQPSLLNYAGNIYLFYTSGTATQTTTYVEQLDCTSLENVQSLGRKRITCAYDFISNADFAYADGMIYMTCDTHPFPAGRLDFISAKQSVYCAPWDGSFNSLEGLPWERVALIGIETTGHERNHNGCFVRDGYGRLAARQVYVSTADDIGDWSSNLYTYRFMAIAF